MHKPTLCCEANAKRIEPLKGFLIKWKQQLVLQPVFLKLKWSCNPCSVRRDSSDGIKVDDRWQTGDVNPSAAPLKTASKGGGLAECTTPVSTKNKLYWSYRQKRKAMCVCADHLCNPPLFSSTVSQTDMFTDSVMEGGGGGLVWPTSHRGASLWRWSVASWLLCTWRWSRLYRCPLPSNCLPGNSPETTESTSLWTGLSKTIM